ncbi:hypothetical protein [Halomonas sp. HAL1]|uniref:hypothetical protein n=1 Tax=Halomonas sp. HAL1 TaxID=550984 RepID=UPI000680BFBB|nr:hypothetical protein [Halomonas sp. HAL1]WKV92688.1 hypothetical protein Q3Y66_17855 [Halomonas sp. HAL1]
MTRRAEAVSGGTFASLSGAARPCSCQEQDPNHVGIEHRPTEVDDRLIIGHREGDTLLKGHNQSGLVTLVERRSGYLMTARLPKITAELSEKAMIRLL